MPKPKKTSKAAARKPAVPVTAAQAAARPITFEQFTESAMGAVLRAVTANRLTHAPVIIGVIWHPGLGTSGSGGYGTQPTSGFVGTVKPFFTDCYRQHMMFMFDLWDANAVQQNWQQIHDAVANGHMPAPGCPGTFDQAGFLTAFQSWKDQGFPA
jgi:hypothetical protein